MSDLYGEQYLSEADEDFIDALFDFSDYNEDELDDEIPF